MEVFKRDGRKQNVQFDKILNRINSLKYNLGKKIDPTRITQKVITGMYNGVTTTQLDELAAQQCISLITEHPDYGILASRIVISSLHKNTVKKFSDLIENLYNSKDVHNNTVHLVSHNLYDIVQKNKDKIDNEIIHNRDYSFDYFGIKTLERAYLLKVDSKIVERPQHLYMRVSLGIHGNDLDEAFKTYKFLSEKWYTHATPTLFNAGTLRPQLSSCFLLAMQEDSVEGIYNTLKDCAKISKWAGGIGLHIHNIRATGSLIRGTNGVSNGIKPMLRVFNNTARYIDQGGGKRNGSIAMYIEPWHADIYDFLDMRKNHGDEESRARDLFYALWIPDLFMKRVKNNKKWSLFCPDIARGLADVWGDEFEELYSKYEREEKYVKQIDAQDLWFSILVSQIETGTPYMLYKDTCNRKSNQKNLGTIKSSNLCTEIIEYTDKDETAVCNLANISLPKFIVKEKFKNVKVYSKKECQYCTKVKNYLKIWKIPYEEIIIEKLKDRIKFYESFDDEEVDSMPQVFHNDIHIGGFEKSINYFRPTFDFNKLCEITEYITKNLNKVIDVNFYPIESAQKSNIRHRPIGLGVQGLADVFCIMKLPFCSPEAKKLNKDIFETIYYGALKNSMELSKIYGSYDSFFGSPASQGILQFDMWNVKPSDRWDWITLKENIKQDGLRNSLLVAPMPTASTAQIMGNNECFEPYTSNIYTRKTLAGDFVIVNKHLLEDLYELGLWNNKMKNNIIEANGSIQNIEGIPYDIKNIYKTVWEMKQRDILNMAVDRGAFIDQSQSLNIFMADPDYQKLTSMHFYGWEHGLKTGMYYLRTQAAAQAIQFTVEKTCLSCT